jgi:hypothetical protein
MAMNPLDAANAKGCIDSVISRTRTKLLPQVPEMTIRLAQSVESGTFPMRLPLIHSNVSMERANEAGMGRTKSSVAVIRKRRFGKVFHPGSWKGQYDAGEWSSQRRDGV